MLCKITTRLRKMDTASLDFDKEQSASHNYEGGAHLKTKMIDCMLLHTIIKLLYECVLRYVDKIDAFQNWATNRYN